MSFLYCLGSEAEVEVRLLWMRANCQASLKATPAPQRSPKGYPEDFELLE